MSSSCSSIAGSIPATNAHNQEPKSKQHTTARAKPNMPLGTSLFGLCFKFNRSFNKRLFHKTLVFLLTFLAYATFHMGRRPFTVVKNVLNRNCSLVPRQEQKLTYMVPSLALALQPNNGVKNHARIEPALSDGQIDKIIAAELFANAEEVFDNNVEGDSKAAIKMNKTQNGARTVTSLAKNSIDSMNNKNYNDDEDDDPNWCDWKPFDGDDIAEKLLAFLDGVFLASYALSMFFAGPIAERLNLRYLLAASCCVSGGSLIALGLARTLEIHEMYYFTAFQTISGAAQAFAWPIVVTCVANWFGSSSRGLLFAVWNSHTNIGNIAGLVIAGAFVESNWLLSFVVPGGVMIAVGVILLLFLVPHPLDVGLDSKEFSDECNEQPEYSCRRRSSTDSSSTVGDASHNIGQKPLVGKCHASTANLISSLDSSLYTTGDCNYNNNSSEKQRNSLNTQSSSPELQRDEQRCIGSGEERAVSFMEALSIPGVIEFSLCLFFAKLVSYTFLFWLPRYITKSTASNSAKSAFLSIPFDMGGIVGAIAAGALSDTFGANALTCNAMLLFAIPSMICYQQFGVATNASNIVLQSIVGAFVNGPYCLITTAISAELGDKPAASSNDASVCHLASLTNRETGDKSNQPQQHQHQHQQPNINAPTGKAMATVVGIIDGAGSLGAVVGPSLAPYFMAYSCDSVFLMLIVADILAMACLARLSTREWRKLCCSSSSGIS